MNAVQRRYPQIYKSTDRLLLKPETINVGLRDFMISIKSTFYTVYTMLSINTLSISASEIVPSSARSSSSMAASLPPQFEPLLSGPLEKLKKAIDRVLPVEKKLSALEEAEFEDEGGDEGALEREMLMQCEWFFGN